MRADVAQHPDGIGVSADAIWENRIRGQPLQQVLQRAGARWFLEATPANSTLVSGLDRCIVPSAAVEAVGAKPPGRHLPRGQCTVFHIIALGWWTSNK